MVIANTQQASSPWGAEAVVCCWGTEGGPYTTVSAANPLPVSIGATVTVSVSGTVGVTGTFWQATQPVSIAATVGVTQSGTWTVQPGNTQNTTPWLVQDVPQTSGGLTTNHY